MKKTVFLVAALIIIFSFAALAFSKIPAPEIVEASSYPEKVQKGDLLEITAEVTGAVKNVEAQVWHENGFDALELKKSGNAQAYKAVWKVHDTKIKNYSIIITATDILSQKGSAAIKYEDPLGDADTLDGMHWWHSEGVMTSANSIKVYVDDKAAAAQGGVISGTVLRLTNTLYAGNLGGQTGGDAKCAAEFGEGWKVVWSGTPVEVDAVIGANALMGLGGWDTRFIYPPFLETCRPPASGTTPWEYSGADRNGMRASLQGIAWGEYPDPNPPSACSSQVGIWCYKDNPAPQPQSGDVVAIAKISYVKTENGGQTLDCPPGVYVDSYTAGTYRAEYDPYNVASLVPASGTVYSGEPGNCNPSSSQFANPPSVACAAGYTLVLFEDSFVGTNGNDDGFICGSPVSGGDTTHPHCGTYYCKKN